jgi:rhodanese-related sulfurtransferase/DNA-binding transcriptional ArsR family regulator
MPSSSRQFKDTLYQQFARVGKAVAAPKRMELLDILCQGPRTVEVLAQQAEISVANASQHLQVLRAARLVDAEKMGLYVEYRIADEEVLRFFVALRELAGNRLAEIETVTRQFFENRTDMEAIESQELSRRVKAGEVIVLDVRPSEEYRAGHIPKAISIPVNELKNRLGELPGGKLIIAYCRGPYCVMSLEAVEILRNSGRDAQRLKDGVPEWIAHGFRVARARTGKRL